MTPKNVLIRIKDFFGSPYFISGLMMEGPTGKRRFTYLDGTEIKTSRVIDYHEIN